MLKCLKYALLKIIFTFYLNSLPSTYFLAGKKCYLKQDTEIMARSQSKHRAIMITFIFSDIPFNTAKSLYMY